MGRLIKSALYQGSEEPYFGNRDGMTDLRDPAASWENAPRRIRKIDPYGMIAYSFFRQMDASYSKRKAKGLVALVMH